MCDRFDRSASVLIKEQHKRLYILNSVLSLFILDPLESELEISITLQGMYGGLFNIRISMVFFHSFMGHEGTYTKEKK